MKKEKIHAVIMAGGMGKRLYPLTESTPKPLLPIAGVPIIKRIFDDIKRIGIEKATVTLGYLANKMKSECVSMDTSGLEINFSCEDSPLGTAGGVKKALSGKNYEYALVISGDAMYEGFPEKAFDVMESKDADGVILSYRVPDPERFGVIVEKEGRIMRFVEKPERKDAPSDLVSTGIYLLKKSTVDMIPDSVYDFGKELFPKMLKEGKSIYSCECLDFWCDIGTVSSYYDCNMRKSNWKSIIGDAYVSSEAKIVSSIVFDGAFIGKGCTLDNCIIGNNVHISDNVRIESGAIIGEGSLVSSDVKKNTSVLPNTVIY